LFRLETAASIQDRLTFHNTGPEQIPGLIVMSLSDRVGDDLDPERDMIVVLFNATPDEQMFTIPDFVGEIFHLHRVQLESNDPVVRQARFEVDSGAFLIPARTTAVFELPQSEEVEVTVVEEAPAEATAVPAAEPIDIPAAEESALEEGAAAADDASPNWPMIAGGVVAVGVGGGMIALSRRRRKKNRKI
jgi:hypothetical protein